MKKEELESLIDQEKSQREISSITGKSQTTVRYWLKKHGLSTKTRTIGEERVCPMCRKTLSRSDFYKKRGVSGASAYCKACTNSQITQRQRVFKKLCVEYKGGKCESCGYSKYDGALEFHHKDPSEKDFSISKARHTNFNERVKDELDKCALLCSNCHKEEHALIRGLL